MSSTGLNNSIKKKTAGRQKIEIKEIEDVNRRQVTFSKRRAGLFKKASELCILTGAEVSAIVTSRSNRTFAFSSKTDPTDLMNSCVSDESRIGQNQGEKIRELEEKYSQLMAAVEEEEKRGKRIAEERSGGARVWWEEEMDRNMNVEELEIYMKALEKLERNVQVKAEELMMRRVMEMAADPLQMLQSGFFPSYDPSRRPF